MASAEEKNPKTERKSPALILAGPTASGKTALALKLAEVFGGEIINADSMQVYDALPILTAQPSPIEQKTAPHRLFGALPPGERCSAGRWRELALAEMEATTAKGRVPIIAGGTGFYLSALEGGIAEIPPVPPEKLQKAEKLFAELGGEAFLERLAEVDPQSGAKLHPNDRQRLLRAWSVYETSGRSLSDWQRSAPHKSAPYDFIWLVMDCPRDWLYARCDARLDVMIESGVLEEIEAFMKAEIDPALPIMKALGLRPLAAHLAGEMTLEEALQQAKAETRQYAKRQMTWIRNQILGQKKPVIEVDAQHLESIQPKIFTKIRNMLLT